MHSTESNRPPTPFERPFLFPVSHVVHPFTVLLQITSSSFTLSSFYTKIVSPSSFRFNSSPYFLSFFVSVLALLPILHLFCTLLINIALPVIYLRLLIAISIILPAFLSSVILPSPCIPPYKYLSRLLMYTTSLPHILPLSFLFSTNPYIQAPPFTLRLSSQSFLVLLPQILPLSHSVAHLSTFLYIPFSSTLLPFSLLPVLPF